LFVSIDITKVQQHLRKDKDKKRRLLNKKSVFLKTILAIFLFLYIVNQLFKSKIPFIIC